MLVGHLGRVRDQRRVRHVEDRELVLQALGIREYERAVLAPRLDALAAEPVGPEVERVGGADAVDQPCTIPAPAVPGAAPGYSKNVRSWPGAPSSSP